MNGKMNMERELRGEVLCKCVGSSKSNRKIINVMWNRGDRLRNKKKAKAVATTRV